MSMWTFFREFTRDPVQLGAVAPSGEVLAKLMIECADLKPDQVIVELGAGTGPMTAEILRARPEGPFVALEPNPQLAELLRQRFPHVRVEQRYAQQLRAILTEMGQTRADRVVSSLPWAIWSEPLQNEIFDAILDVLAPDGVMVTFGYVHAQPLPAAKRLRAQLASRFETVELSPIAWRNIPPARVFVCRQPRKAKGT